LSIFTTYALVHKEAEEETLGRDHDIFREMGRKGIFLTKPTIRRGEEAGTAILQIE
jgi:hypothetical protein